MSSPDYLGLSPSSSSAAATFVGNHNYAVSAAGAGGVVVSDESIVAEAAGLLGLVVRLALANVIFNALRPDPQVAWSWRLPRMLWELSLAAVARGAVRRNHNVASAVDSDPDPGSSRRGGRRRWSKKSKEAPSVSQDAPAVAAESGGDSKTSRENRESRLLSASPSRFLLLAVMLVSTALADIFVWAPVFAAAVSFTSCAGGWLTGEPRRCHADLAKGYGRALVVAQSVLGGTIYLLSGLSAWNVYATQQQRRSAARHAEIRERHWQQQVLQAQADLEHRRRAWLLEEEDRRRRLRDEEEEAAKKAQEGSSSFWSTPNFWSSL
jgi:hypothetical protein